MTLADSHLADALRMYQPAQEHPRETELPVTGSVPPELRGTLYRNGPADWDHGGFRAAHPFDGDGLVVKFTIADGAVRFRSRFVDTPKRRKEGRGRGAHIRGVYTQGKHLWDNVGRPPADTANTHAVVHADRLLALSDAGSPWEIDRDDLSTIGPCTFDGRLPRLSRFSPHPRIDPDTGELFNFGLDVAPSLSGPTVACLRCFRVDVHGRLTQIAKIPTDHIYIQHDFAITPTYLVFALAPITVNPLQAARAALGFGSLGDAAAYRPDQGMRIVLVPRDGSPHRVIECDPVVYVHVDNAYEDRGDVVLDILRHKDFEFLASGLKQFRTETPTLGWPARLRVTRRGTVEVTDYPMAPAEFPTHDERRTGRKHRYTYLSAESTSGESAIVKLDRAADTQRSHTFAPGLVAGEPLFVPKNNAAGEDEGWILAVAYNSGEHRTELHILDATAIEDPALAIAILPSHHFPGFHGSFTERV
ncbi:MULTISPECIES: carotenoid oxygenase family protein [unclassified Mycobacteroides]|uniref:carotenoid oxygenase family protein n=1 Tax=unclassified Mycobacteroides TaxID=2618759 RepID=UPI002814D9CD|nr:MULTISPECIES: carotenoid oxygenase family protein [unclassified Mycobacteroides]